MRRPFSALVPLLLLAPGCPGDSGQGVRIERIDQRSLVRVITADDAKVLDPHVTSDGGNVKVINQVYETLVQLDPQDSGRLLPELAESWTVGEDGKSISFRIRTGVRFHDGASLDAAACKLSLDRARGADFELPTAPYRSMFADIESVEADGQRLVVRLAQPVAGVTLRNLSMFAASIVSPRLLEESRRQGGADAASAYVTAHAAGTGAYRVDAFDPAAKVVRLVANEESWRGAPQIKTLVFQQVLDKRVRHEYLRKAEGTIVVDDVPRESWDELRSSPRLALKTWWSLNVCYLGVSGVHPKTREPEVRRAIQLAIDRQAILPHYKGTARPTYSLVAQPMPEYDPELRCGDWDDDLAVRRKRARALLEAAQAIGREVTIYYPNQPRPYLPEPTEIADAVRHSLKEVGLEAKIQGVDKNVLFPGIATGEYELVLIGWTTDNAHPDNFYGPLCDGEDGVPSEGNVSRVFDPEVHAKIVAARQLVDDAQRVAAYREIERLLQDRVRGYVPLVNTQVALAHSKRIQGIEVNDMGQYRFHAARLVD